MKVFGLLLAVCLIHGCAATSYLSTEQLEELAALCNTTVPEYDPSETEFMGDAMYVSIPNAEIGYYRFGNSSSTRPAIILVAGFGSTQGSWPLRFLETLALEHEVITFDNRGQGISTDTNPEVPISILSMANDTKNFAESLDLEQPAHLVGWSMGGMITLTAASNFGEYFDKFVVFSGSAGSLHSVAPSAQGVEVLTNAASLNLTDALDPFFPMQYESAQVAACYYELEGVSRLNISANATTTSRQMNAIINYYFEDTEYNLLNVTDQNIYIVGGTLDPIVAGQNQKLAAKRLPYAWLTMFGDSAHAAFIQHLDTVLDVMDIFFHFQSSSE